MQVNLIESFSPTTLKTKHPKMSQKSVLIAFAIAIVLMMSLEAEAKRKSERAVKPYLWSLFPLSIHKLSPVRHMPSDYVLGNEEDKSGTSSYSKTRTLNWLVMMRIKLSWEWLVCPSLPRVPVSCQFAVAETAQKHLENLHRHQSSFE